MKKILLVGSQHGNEKLGDRLYMHLQQNHPSILPHIDYVIGNPRAHAKDIRYIESDMNRSYAEGVITYESAMASQLLRKIGQKKYDIVLDLHTTKCVQSPSVIVNMPSDEAKTFLSSSSIEYIVHMKPAIAATSLIGRHKATVAIEVQDDMMTDDLLEALACDLQRYIANEIYETERKVFHVTDYLAKGEIPEEVAVRLKNFKQTKYGYYPILVGENSYKKQTDYLGFKAIRVQ